MAKIIVVVGAGPGIGNAVARRFGKGGYEVVLISRNQRNLDTYKEKFEELQIPVSVYAADVTDIKGYDETIERIRADHGDPNVVVYNVGITAKEEEPFPVADVMSHFAADVAGAYETIQQFATPGFAENQGSIIFTGGDLSVSPRPGYVALSMDKAALRNLALEKNGELAERGIFVGTVMVCGFISENDDHFTPDNIAGAYWELNEKRDSFEFLYE